MSTPRRAVVAVAAIIAIAFVLSASAACSSDSGSDKTATPHATIPATSAPSTATIDADAITRVNIAEVADVQAMISETNGAISGRDVLYADLSGDGVAEAVVPITSGGTQGNVAVIVLTPDGNGGAATMLSVKSDGRGGMSVDVADNKLVTREARPGPDDPECCPAMLHVTTYAWDGLQLAVESAQDVANPAGGNKATVAPGVPPPNASQ